MSEPAAEQWKSPLAGSIRSIDRSYGVRFKVLNIVHRVLNIRQNYGAFLLLFLAAESVNQLPQCYGKRMDFTVAQMRRCPEKP